MTTVELAVMQLSECDQAMRYLGKGYAYIGRDILINKKPTAIKMVALFSEVIEITTSKIISNPSSTREEKIMHAQTLYRKEVESSIRSDHPLWDTTKKLLEKINNRSPAHRRIEPFAIHMQELAEELWADFSIMKIPVFAISSYKKRIDVINLFDKAYSKALKTIQESENNESRT